MAARKTVKTFDDCRAAILENLPERYELVMFQYTSDNRSHGNWHKSESFSARVRYEKESHEVEGFTPSDLFRKFMQQVHPILGARPRIGTTAHVRTVDPSEPRRSNGSSSSTRRISGKQTLLLTHREEPEDFGGD